MYERIEESVFADHAPAAFLVGIVAEDLRRRIEAITRMLNQHDKSSSSGSIGSISSALILPDDDGGGGDRDDGGSRDGSGYGSVDDGDGGVVSDIRDGFKHVGDGIRGGVISVGESVVSMGRSAYRGVRHSVTDTQSERKELERELTWVQTLQQDLLVDELRELSLSKAGVSGRARHDASAAGMASQKQLSKSFRASAAKKKHGRRFMPLNCHSHQVQRGDGSLCAVVTSGAHCAHSMGFKHGGLLPQLEKHKKTSGEDAALPLSLYHRLACCVSQSLTTMLTALAFDLANKAQDVRYWNLLRACGYLCHFECLLSTAGDENGMLDDHIVAIQKLERVTVEVVCGEVVGEKDAGSSSTSTFSIDGQRRHNTPRVVSMTGSLSSNIVVRIDLGVHIAALGLDDEKYFTFGIFPVLVTQGINEQQTIANAVGSAGRQNNINQRALRRLGR